jgi:PAS domain S-box-containing protein
MLAQLKPYFLSPIFSDDDKTRTARVLNVLLLSLSLILVVVLFAIPILFVEKTFNILFTSVFLVLIMTSLVLMRSGHVQIAAWIFIGGAGIALTVFLFFAGGMTTAATAFYFLGIVFAGSVLGTRAAVFLSVSASLAGLGMVILEKNGNIPPRLFPMPSQAGWLDVTMSLAFVTLTIHLAQKDLKQALALAKQQIAERQHIEAALRESEERYRNLFESVPIGLYRTSPTARILDANQYAVNLLKFPNRDTCLSYNSNDLWVDEKEREKFRNLIRRESVATDFEAQFRRYDGTIIWVQLNTYMELDQKGHVLYNSGTLQDITAHKQAEKALQASEQTARQTTEQLRMVNQMMLNLTSGLDIEQLMERLYEQCQRVAYADTFYIALYDSETDMLNFPFGYTDGKRYFRPPFKMREKGGFPQHVIENRQTLLIPDTHLTPADIPFVAISPTPSRTRSYVGIPLVIDDQVIGLLSMQSVEPNTYTPEQVQTLELLAPQVAIAIQNARLYTAAQQELQERQRVEQSLQASEKIALRTADQLRMVNEMMLNLTSGLDIELLMQKLHDQCRRIGPINTFYVLLYDQETETLSSLYDYKDGERRTMPPRNIRENPGVTGYVIEHRQTLYLPDTLEKPAELPPFITQPGRKNRTLVVVPLILKHKVIGVLSMQSVRPNAYTPEQVHTLELLAPQVAIAIQNARLHEQIEKQVDELSNLLWTVEQAREEWQRTVDAMDEGILLVDGDNKILRANKAIANWMHATPQALVGQPSHLVTHTMNNDPSINTQEITELPHSVTREAEASFLGKIFQQTSFPIHDANQKNRGTVHVVKDITEEKNLQAQMIQSEKLAAMGTLAASLAHEIQNPLQAIDGCLTLAQEAIENTEQRKQYMAMVQEEFERLAKIVQQILDYFRPSKGIRSPINVKSVVDDVSALSNKRMQLAKVQMKMEWDDTIPAITATNSQLKQVFLNLILNAIDAMPTGGKILIRGKQVLGERPWVTIAVQDTGVGIAPDKLARIFDPFFSTKTTGTGLGLAVCKTIIENHSGRITVESAVGQGSTFTVWLPCDNPT